VLISKTLLQIIELLLRFDAELIKCLSDFL
jgi:hypothetical protein